MNAIHSGNLIVAQPRFRRYNECMDRKILHIDMNSFYASVELLTRPDLRDKPVVVGGDESLRHGIVLAKNEIAKAFGIKTAETLYSARQKAPHLVVLPPHHELYHEYSQRAQSIYREYSERVQPFGPDEAWLDVSHRPESGEALAAEIKARVRGELGLTVSVGVSWNKTFAKMGSDHRKPDAITLITRENYKDILWQKPVDEFLFVGAATAARLQQLGIRTVGDLAAADPEQLSKILGKNAWSLVFNACGEDDSPVLSEAEQGPPKSIGVSQTTSRDLTKAEAIRDLFEEISGEVAQRMAEQGMRGRTVRIVVRDTNFVTKTRQRSLVTAVTEASDILREAWELYEEHFAGGVPLRLLGITIDQLESRDAAEQMSLDDLLAQTPRSASAAKAANPLVDALLEELQQRFGPEHIRKGYKKDR